MQNFSAVLEENGKTWANAAQWIKKSADQGKLEAQFALGILYRDGFGVKKNLNTSLFWLSKAALNGERKAIQALKVCFFLSCEPFARFDNSRCALANTFSSFSKNFGLLIDSPLLRKNKMFNPKINANGLLILI